jgi:hypothetical protein
MSLHRFVVRSGLFGTLAIALVVAVGAAQVPARRSLLRRRLPP